MSASDIWHHVCESSHFSCVLLFVNLITVAHSSSAAAAKSLQSCPTLCDPIDSSPPGSPVPGNLHARTLEWVAISFSNAWKWKVKMKSLSPVRLLATAWTAAYQVPLSMGFSRQEYWSGLLFPTLGYLPNSGIQPPSFKSPAQASVFFTTNTTSEAHVTLEIHIMPMLRRVHDLKWHL